MPQLGQQGVFLELDGRVDDIMDNMKSIMRQVTFTFECGHQETMESL